MAWGTVRSYVVGRQGDTITTILNAQVRDKLAVLGAHGHSGADGEGAAALDGVETVTVVDEAGDVDAPGADKLQLYAVGGTLRQRAGAAGSAETLSVEGHSH